MVPRATRASRPFASTFLSQFRNVDFIRASTNSILVGHHTVLGELDGVLEWPNGSSLAYLFSERGRWGMALPMSVLNRA